jgi:Plasmid pRiA4b ORF-3-like protein
MKDFTLSPDQEQFLRDQVIDADRPGPVLHDFRAVLEYVGPDGVPAAGKYNLLPIDAIDTLDARLSRPLKLSLKRPQLRSHPYLLGLHLLFRASGLSRIEGTGAKARLVLDPMVLERWNRLNPTEQYFTLLEAWFLHGKPEMVGERGGVLDDFLYQCLMTWQALPARGKKFDVSRPQEVYVGLLGRNFYLLALADLFGLFAVEYPRRAVQPWCPASVGHTPFGDAVFTLLGQRYPAPWDREDEEGPTEGPAFGKWQPLFQPYFPEWRDNLVLPAAEPRAGVFIFRVALGKVWRRLALPADATLDDLADWILNSVNFDDDHLYEFIYRDRFGREVRALHPECDEGPWTNDIRLGDLPLELGQAMTFHFDFGDDWRFDVKLERIDPPGKRLKAPRILEKHGKAPEQYPYSDW